MQLSGSGWNVPWNMAISLRFLSIFVAVIFTVIGTLFLQPAAAEPFFTEFPGVKSRRVGGRVEFSCTGYGDNLREIYWVFKDKRIENSDHFHIIPKYHGSTLQIVNVTENLAGAYCCCLDNGYRIWDNCGTLKVKTAPAIIYQPKSVSAYEGEDAIITCTVKAHPAPTIAWLHNGQIICRIDTNKYCSISFSNYPTHGATLEIFGVSLIDAGFYQCNATNDQGLAYSESAVLKVAGLTTKEIRTTMTQDYQTSLGTKSAEPTTPLQPSVTMDLSHILNNITSYSSVFSSSDLKYHENLSNPHSTILIVIFLGVTLLVLVVIFIICIRREDPYLNRPSTIRRWNTKRVVACPNKYDTLQKLNYPTEKLDIIQELGEGVFGLVYKARAPGLLVPHETATVAVKTIRSGNHENQAKMCDFQREAELLSTFHHKNIIELLGICTESEKANGMRAISGLLFEYMDGGDLCAYLRKCGPNKEFFFGKSPSLEFEITEKDKLVICTHIACGMQYLSERNFIHRDLATRNCLISAQDFNIKIADFGLSRQTYQSDYYKAGETESLPIRWMSPEAILYRRYSTQSDVWAYGVTLWEIYSYALQPYFSLSNEEVICCVCQGKILSPPEAVPPWMFNLMQLCWQHSPENRPKFSTIHSVLQAIALNDGRPPKETDKNELYVSLQYEQTKHLESCRESKQKHLIPPPQDFRSDPPVALEDSAPNLTWGCPSNKTKASPLGTNPRFTPLRRVVSDVQDRRQVQLSSHRFSHASLGYPSSLCRTVEMPATNASSPKPPTFAAFGHPSEGFDRSAV